MFHDYHLYEHWTVFSPILGIIVGVYLMSQSNKQLLKAHNFGLILGLSLAVFVWLWIGTRYKTHYGDSYLYCHSFESAMNGMNFFTNPKEWVWNYFALLCVATRDITIWYLVIAAFYVGGMAFACLTLTPKHFFVAFVFFLTSSSFFAYGTNGIRNGMATSVTLIGLSIIASNLFKNKNISSILGLLIIIISSGIHNSLSLVAATAVLAYFYRDTKIYMYIWIACIFLSFVGSGPILSVLGHFTDDERLMVYGTGEVSNTMFSKTGFRWDFILYSSVPILLGYFTIIKKHINDNAYTYLLNVYLIANSFWCTINSVSYSNRFAYLSWFMMPILIAYPMIKFNVFKDQGLISGCLMIGFTIFNLIFGYT